MKATITLCCVVIASIPFGGVYAGCIIRNVVNDTTTCTLTLGGRSAPPSKTGQASVTAFNETVGEYRIMEVEEDLGADGTICKEYKIQVAEGDQGRGSIRLLRSDDCGSQDFSKVVRDYENISLTRCVLDVHVHNSDDVRIEIMYKKKRSLPTKQSQQTTKSPSRMTQK